MILFLVLNSNELKINKLMKIKKLQGGGKGNDTSEWHL